ncbi:MAG: zinc-binding dehydrogenase [Candidatus Rokubacteria bacterium]|nr:zinc-binding dehydrogenase [Candidatus Rokubacteria bacterium]
MGNRRAVITRWGGPEVLAIVEDELPEPGPGQVQVAILASGVAFGDVLKRYGLVPRMPRLPYTPGYDLVGVVETVGSGIERWKGGDRVAALVMNGANAERANVTADALVPVPPAVGDAEALCLVLNYVTAWQLLHRAARVKAGERILVHGAAGGVGTALLQLGRLHGLEMLGTASRGKHAVVSALGATPIDYRSEDFVARARALGGADAVFDPIGGAHLARSHRALRRGGRLVAYGVSAAIRSRLALPGTFALVALYALLPDGRQARFFGVGMRGGPETVREDLAKLLDLRALGQIQPIIGARLPLAEIGTAHRMMERAEVTGKIVLVPA